jgi:hypothetical protein
MSTSTSLTWNGDRQLRGVRVDVHGRADHFAVARAGTEVERAGVLGDVDRQAERRTLVGAGEEYLAAFDEVRFGARAGTRGQFPDLALRAARALRGLRFVAQGDLREVPRQARRRRDRQPAEIFFGVFAAERHPQRAVAAGLV